MLRIEESRPVRTGKGLQGDIFSTILDAISGKGAADAEAQKKAQEAATLLATEAEKRRLALTYLGAGVLALGLLGAMVATITRTTVTPAPPRVAGYSKRRRR